MEKPDCIAIGTTVRLISLTALCHGAGMAPPEARYWLAQLGVPVVALPNGGVYFNLFALEAMLLRRLSPSGFRWQECLKELAAIYGAAEKQFLMERAREVGRRLESTTKFLKPLVKRRRRG